MSKLRLRFVKEGTAVYLSHLDLLRTFQRVFIRTGLVLRHSQGFHPHPILTLALPLPVGQSSVCELLDFETVGNEPPKTVADRLNSAMPAGIRALDCWEPVKSLGELAFLEAAVTFAYDRDLPLDWEKKLSEVLDRDQLVVQKRTKRKALADVDLKPMLAVAQLEGDTLLVRVQAQNPGMNPALLAQAVGNLTPELAPDFVRVRRLSLLDREGKEFR